MFRREIAKPIVRPRTKSIILRKFPTPYLSTLEDPSINKARSIFALQADKIKENAKTKDVIKARIDVFFIRFQFLIRF